MNTSVFFFILLKSQGLEPNTLPAVGKGEIKDF